jgi:uncharacterized protein (TIGR02145 family)/uncharacterized repeat protein (TIGR02543 family)
MRKITQWLLLLLIAVSFQAKAQDYNISFAILGSSDKPTTVKVENTTQSTETTLNGTDVLNLVADLTGISELSSNAENAVKVFPNPVSESATLSFYNPVAENVVVCIVNTAGVQVATISKNLPLGEASYTLSGLSTSNYIVNVQSASYHSSCIVISQLESAVMPQIVFREVDETDFKASANLLKSASTSQTVIMQYNEGDVLKFTATVNAKDAIVDNYTATQNEEIEFTFSFTVTFADHNGTELKTETVDYGNSATAPVNPIRTGYTFDSWDKAFDNISADLTVNATYSINSYTICYHNVGTKNAAANPASYTIESTDITLATPTDSTGYKFGGWYTNAALTDTISSPSIAQGSMGDTAFYAKWDWIPVPISDYEGNTYSTVKIGNQFWTTENLRATKYADGTAIPNVDDRMQNGSGADNTAWANLGDNGTAKAYCWYNNDSISYWQTYGALYTYAAATNSDNSGSNVQGVCPTGWHLPSDAEWTTLTDYLTANGHSGAEGTALKATSGWSNNGNGTDNYGFAALPAGNRQSSNGEFRLAGSRGYWWSSTQFDSSDAYYRYPSDSYAGVARAYSDKLRGHSVRCVRD